MMEARQIVRLWEQGGATVLVTLVRAEGSSDWRLGARLLLGADGVYAGTISDSGLEMVRRAGWKVRAGAVVERCPTTFDDTAEIPGGLVDLLMEPVDTPEYEALMAAVQGALRGETSTVLTWLPREGRRLARAVLAESGDFSFASEELTEPELVEVRRSVLRGLAVGREEDGIFVERLRFASE